MARRAAHPTSRQPAAPQVHQFLRWHRNWTTKRYHTWPAEAVIQQLLGQAPGNIVVRAGICLCRGQCGLSWRGGSARPGRGPWCPGGRRVRCTRSPARRVPEGRGAARRWRWYHGNLRVLPPWSTLTRAMSTCGEGSDWECALPCGPRVRGWRWSRTSTWHKGPRPRRAGQSRCQAMRRRTGPGSPGSRRCRARPGLHLGPPVGADSPQKPVPKSWRGTVASTCCW